MASKRDYYEVLGVPRDADASAIKSAYRKLAVRHHPDRNQSDPAAEEKFKEAAEAYAVLSDSEKRARYDRFGHQAAAAGGFGGFDPSIFGDFSDILGDLFGFGGFGGRGRARTRGVPGADLRYDLSLSFEQAAFGHEVEIRIPRLETCERCSGTGSRDGQLKTCATCGGQGRVRFSQGFFSVAQTCPQCRGEGQMVADPCRDCRGDGRQLGYPQLVLGTTVEVETLHGKEKLRVPPGTTPGHEFRLRGQGIPRLNSDRRGDHVVHAALKVPKLKDLDDERIELLQQLAELEGTEVHEHGGVLDKVKSLFS